jgi:hypothetical protein
MVQGPSRGDTSPRARAPTTCVGTRRSRLDKAPAGVAEGLRRGESVVVDGQPRLVAGAKVEVRQPDRAGAGRGKGKGSGGKGDGAGKAESPGKAEAGAKGKKTE